MASPATWLRCYRCWSQSLEAQVHYEGNLKVDAETGEARDPDEENIEAAVRCTDCLHDQPQLVLELREEDGRRVARLGPVEERWERMVLGTPWVASCAVTVAEDEIEACSGPEAGEYLTQGAFGEAGAREFFTHVRFHQHDGDRIVVHVLTELYARSAEEAASVLEEAARGELAITSLAEESRPPAAPSGESPH
jgi:hypothetical protein